MLRATGYIEATYTENQREFGFSAEDTYLQISIRRDGAMQMQRARLQDSSRNIENYPFWASNYVAREINKFYNSS